ncbi:MAG: hypothetical protein KJP23_30435, partial [Deltaproteobacteria bacterium]|nr:hypothetical protein [Deltaproteobacteria bacterium]
MVAIELRKKINDANRSNTKTKFDSKLVLPRIMVLFFSLLLINNSYAIVYVDKDRSGGNGTSWADAYNSIEDAIAGSGENQEFWVAEGTYTPSSHASWGTQLIPKQASQFYGGFAGNETSRDQRDVSAHPTIIDGGPNNLIHVILIKLETKDVTIDGFTIKNGSATGDGSVYWDKFGGGIFADIVEESGHNTTILNCTFENNTATEQGGAVFINRRNATFENCVFQSNNSKTGGALGATDTDLVYDAILTLSDCTFNSNQANLGAATSQRGGAIWTLKLSTVIQRSTFTGNSAGQLGGAVEFNQPRSA